MFCKYAVLVRRMFECAACHLCLQVVNLAVISFLTVTDKHMYASILNQMDPHIFIILVSSECWKKTGSVEAGAGVVFLFLRDMRPEKSDWLTVNKCGLQ